MIVNADGVVYVGKRRVIVKENRHKYPNTTYDSCIYDLEFQNQPVLELGDTDVISFFASDDHGFEMYGQGSWEEVLPGIYAWVARVSLPSTPGYVRITWTIQIGGAIEYVKDKCQVVPLN